MDHPGRELWQRLFKQLEAPLLSEIEKESFIRPLAKGEDVLQALDSVVFKGLDERLLFYLKRYKQAIGKEVKLSHQQIAEELNSFREVFPACLGRSGHFYASERELEIEKGCVTFITDRSN